MRKPIPSLLLSALLAIVVLSFVVPDLVRPWYSDGHRIIATSAIKLLPPKMKDLFTYYGYVINASANYPDLSWADLDANEGPKHYIDLEVAGANLENKDVGVLPYAINSTYNAMVQYWKVGDYGAAFIYAGALCHYVGDSGQPYHTTVNYNPKGKHGLADSLLESHLGEITLVQSDPLTPVENVFQESVGIIRESYSWLPTLNKTLIGDPNNSSDDRDWSPELKDMVQDRTNKVIIFTARLWVSAVRAAGGEVPDVPSENALKLTVSAPTEVFDNKSARVRIVVVDSLGVPVSATVTAKLGGVNIYVGSASDKNPIGKYEGLMDITTLVANSGTQAELNVSASFTGRSPASWKGAVLVKSSRPPQAGSSIDISLVGISALVAIVIIVVVLGVLRGVRRR